MGAIGGNVDRTSDGPTDSSTTERTGWLPPPRTASNRPVVIAIASTPSDRERLVGLVDDVGPVLLVSNAQEARAFLDGDPAFAGPDEERPRDVSLGGLRVDRDRHVAEWDGHEAQLTPLEHDLLVCLLSEPGHTWTFERLHEAVWGTRHIGAGSDLHSLVKRARRKLASLGTPFGIDAIRGVGFRLANPDSTPRRTLTSVNPAVG